MNQYELMYILPSGLTEDEAPVEASKVSAKLNEHGVQITQEVDLGKKKLAYPINHERYGYYRLVEFTAEPAVIAKLNEMFRLSRDIVRHLIIAKPVKSPAVLEREQALRDKLAARRQKNTPASAPAAAEATEEKADITNLSAEELDKKLSQILDEDPNV